MNTLLKQLKLLIFMLISLQIFAYAQISECQALNNAVYYGNADTVSKMIADNKKLCSCEYAGSNTLFSAIDKPNILKVLIDGGCSIDVKRSSYSATPLAAASNSGRIESVKILLDAGANPNENVGYRYPLESAIMYPDIVKLLVEHGANVNVRQENLLRSACSTNKVETARILLENGIIIPPKVTDNLKNETSALIEEYIARRQESRNNTKVQDTNEQSKITQTQNTQQTNMPINEDTQTIATAKNNSNKQKTGEEIYAERYKRISKKRGDYIDKHPILKNRFEDLIKQEDRAKWEKRFLEYLKYIGNEELKEIANYNLKNTNNQTINYDRSSYFKFPNSALFNNPYLDFSVNKPSGDAKFSDEFYQKLTEQSRDFYNKAYSLNLDPYKVGINNNIDYNIFEAFNMLQESTIIINDSKTEEYYINLIKLQIDHCLDYDSLVNQSYIALYDIFQDKPLELRNLYYKKTLLLLEIYYNKTLLLPWYYLLAIAFVLFIVLLIIIAKINKFFIGLRISKIGRLCRSKLKAIDKFIANIDKQKLSQQTKNNLQKELNALKHSVEEIEANKNSAKNKQEFKRLKGILGGDIEPKLKAFKSKLKGFGKINQEDFDLACKWLDESVKQLYSLNSNIETKIDINEAANLSTEITAFKQRVENILKDLTNANSADEIKKYLDIAIEFKKHNNDNLENYNSKWNTLKQNIQTFESDSKQLQSTLQTLQGGVFRLRNKLNDIDMSFREVEVIVNDNQHILLKINEMLVGLKDINSIEKSKSIFSNIRNNIQEYELKLKALNASYSDIEDKITKSLKLKEIKQSLANEQDACKSLLADIKDYRQFSEFLEHKTTLEDISKDIESQIGTISKLVSLNDVAVQYQSINDNFARIKKERENAKYAWGSLKRDLDRFKEFATQVADLLKKATEAKNDCSSAGKEDNIESFIPLFSGHINKLIALEKSIYSENRKSISDYEVVKKAIENELIKVLNEFDNQFTLRRDYKQQTNDESRKKWILQNGKLSWFFSYQDVAKKFVKFDSKGAIEALKNASKALGFFEEKGEFSILEKLKSNMTMQQVKEAFISVVRNEVFIDKRIRWSKEYGENNKNAEIVNQFLGL